MVHYLKPNDAFLHSKNVMEQYVKLKMLSSEQKYNETLLDTNQCFVHSKSVIKHQIQNHGLNYHEERITRY